MLSERIITVFGSSRPREHDQEYTEARELGRLLAERGFAVCSGGYGGVMEAVSRGAKDSGGKTYGVTADFFDNCPPSATLSIRYRNHFWTVKPGVNPVLARNGNRSVLRKPEPIPIARFISR